MNCVILHDQSVIIRPLITWSDGRFLSRTFQVFEVLHYVGSCLLKIIKLRLFGGRKKDPGYPKYSANCDGATSPSDSDPFLVKAENKVFIDNNIIQGQDSSYIFIFLILTAPESEVGFSVESSDNTPRQKTSGEMPAIKSLHVKYSENKEGF